MARCIFLDISSVFCKNHISEILAINFVRFGFCEVFRAFFLHVSRYHYETWYIHLVGSVTHQHQVQVSFQSGHFDLLYSQKQVKVIFLHLWPQKLYRGLRFGKHTNIVSVLISTDFRHGWAIFGPLADKNTRKGELIDPAKSYLVFFSTCFQISVWNLVYTSSRQCHTSVGSPWPTLQPRMGQCNFSSFMASKII